MRQLTLGDLDTIIKSLKANKQFDKSTPIYLGDDEELNGIHECFFCNNLSSDTEDAMYYLDMINEQHMRCNKNQERITKAILIS